MPIRHCIVHLIDKKPDGSPAVLHARDSELSASPAMENLLADLNERSPTAHREAETAKAHRG